MLLDAQDVAEDGIDLADDLSGVELRLLLEAGAAKRESPPEGFVDLARAFVRLGMRAEASAAYTEAIARKVDCREAFVGRGELRFGDALMAQGHEGVVEEAEAALSDYRTAITLVPDRTACLGAGSSLLLLNRLLEADCWFQDLLGASEVANDRSYKIDILFLQALGRVLAGNREKAKLIAVSIESLAGDDCETLFILGVGALAHGELDECRNFHDSLQNKDPKLANALARLEKEGCNSFVDVARALL